MDTFWSQLRHNNFGDNFRQIFVKKVVLSRRFLLNQEHGEIILVLTRALR